MKKLKAQIEELEALIIVYSDRDRIRLEQLEKQLHKLNMSLLDVMSNDYIKVA